MRTKKRAKTQRAPPKVIRRAPRFGTSVVWPSGLEERYGISAPTRWRWEKTAKLPPRDVFIGGRAIGWRPQTLEAAEAGAPAPAA